MLFVIGSVSAASAHCLLHTTRGQGKKQNCKYCKIDWKKHRPLLQNYLEQALANCDMSKKFRYQRHEYDEDQKSFIWIPTYTKRSLMELKSIIKHASDNIRNFSWHYLAKLQWDDITLPGYLHTGENPPRKGLLECYSMDI